MTVTEAYNWGCTELTAPDNPSPALDAEVLLCSVLKLDKENFVSHRNSLLEPAQLAAYQDLVAARKGGMPVAYLTGEKEFYNLKFKVNKHVLIPRPETETLVERIIFETKDRHNLRILDIGTGSGCIIISLANNLSSANFYYGSDDSTRALAVAQDNAIRHRVKVSFLRSDLTKHTGADYDIIIANLPYLPVADHPSVAFEPKEALVAKNHGLELYQRLFHELGQAHSRAIIYLEFGHDQAEHIKALTLQHLPGAEIEIFKDLWGHPRFARIWQKKHTYI